MTKDRKKGERSLRVRDKIHLYSVISFVPRLGSKEVNCSEFDCHFVYGRVLSSVIVRWTNFRKDEIFP